jgi:hypothetical protein
MNVWKDADKDCRLLAMCVWAAKDSLTYIAFKEDIDQSIWEHRWVSNDEINICPLFRLQDAKVHAALKKM